MRQCTKCKLNKEEKEFSFQSKEKGTLQYWCKACIMEARMQRYYAKYEQERATRNAWKEQRTTENRQYLLAYYKEHPCIDCGKDNPILLTFDHRDPTLKSFNIGRKIKSMRWETLLKEISKCDVRCVECHTLRTAYQFGWWLTKI